MVREPRRLVFIIWWSLACLLVPLAVAIWSTAPRADGLPGAADTVLWSLTVAQPLLMMALQWPALAPLQPRAWLWIVAGLATMLLTILIQLALYELAFVVSPASQPVVLPLLYLGVVEAFALALCQAVVIGLWRRGWRSWLVACFVLFLGARLLAWRLAAPLFVSLLQPEIYRQAMIESIAGTVLSWGLFGAVMGWLLWRRLIGMGRSVAVPA